MTTLERPHGVSDAPPTAAPQHSRRWVFLVVVGVLALVLGGAIGYIARGDDGTPDIVAAGADDLTARQEQMIDFLDDYEAAWQAGDADGVTAMFVADGTFGALDDELRVDDGTLAMYIENTSFTSLDVMRPALVNGDEMVTFHRFGGRTYVEVLTFTSDGELLLVSHEILG